MHQRLATDYWLLPTMLQLTNISKTYASPRGPLAILRDFSLGLKAGEFVAVVGASGCGKSTLLLTAGGLLAPDIGTVRIHGTDIYALSADARAQFRAAHMGFVFQQFHLVPYLSVRDNVLTPSLAKSLPNAHARADALLAQFGLTDRATHVPMQLSTGERQRTALARALLHSPQLILADEPTGNLDEANARLVLQHLSDIAAAGTAVLLVTHDPRATAYAHRTLTIGQVQPVAA